jgi:hypothetical protein
VMRHCVLLNWLMRHCLMKHSLKSHVLVSQEVWELLLWLLQRLIPSVAIIGEAIDLCLVDPPWIVDPFMFPLEQHIPPTWHKKKNKVHDEKNGTCHKKES